MGCSSTTCMISDLPINDGDDIVAFLVCTNRHASEFGDLESGHHYEPNALLDPVTLQFYGKYNDYGDIESIEDSFVPKHFVHHFKSMLQNGKVSQMVGTKLTKKEMSDIKFMMSLPTFTDHKYKKVIVKPNKNKKYEKIGDCFSNEFGDYLFERWSKTKLQERIMSIELHLRCVKIGRKKLRKQDEKHQKTFKKLKAMKDVDNTFKPSKVFVHRQVFEKIVEMVSNYTDYHGYKFGEMYETDLNYYIEAIRLNHKRWAKEPSEDKDFWMENDSWEKLRHYGFPEIHDYSCIGEEDYDTTLKSLEWDKQIERGEWKKGGYTGHNKIHYAFRNNIELWYYFQYIADNHDKDLTEFSNELIKFMLFQDGLIMLNRGWRGSFHGTQGGEHKLHSKLLKEISSITNKKVKEMPDDEI